jgi:hypothetical protein
MNTLELLANRKAFIRPDDRLTAVQVRWRLILSSAHMQDRGCFRKLADLLKQLRSQNLWKRKPHWKRSPHKTLNQSRRRQPVK